MFVLTVSIYSLCSSMFGLIFSYTGHFLNMSFLFFSFPILRILHGRFSSILRLIPVSAVVVHAKVLMKRYLFILNRWLEVQKECISIQQFMSKELLGQVILICIGINEMWKIWNQKINYPIMRKFHYATGFVSLLYRAREVLPYIEYYFVNFLCKYLSIFTKIYLYKLHLS